MSRTISFFYRQRERAGFTEKIALRSPGGELEIYVFSQEPLTPDHSDLLADKSFAKSEEYESYHRRLRDAVREKGGGIVATVLMTERESEVEIVNLTREGESPDTYLLLAPGYVATFQDLRLNKDRAQVPIRRGSHLVLPVDRVAQDHLHKLHELLGWLSPDAETLVLNTIWRASLMQRLGRLEEHLAGAASARAQPNTWSGKLRGLADRLLPMPTWLGMAGLIALLALNLLLVAQVRSLKSSLATMTGQLQNLEADGGGEEVRKEPANSQNDAGYAELDKALERLHEHLAQVPATAAGGIIFETHIKNHPARDVAALRGNEIFGWGFVKIFLLTRGEKLEAEDLADPQSRNAVRDLLTVVAPDLENKERALLAFVTCHAVNMAGVPGNPNDSSHGPVTLGLDCADEKAFITAAILGFDSFLKTAPSMTGDT